MTKKCRCVAVLIFVLATTRVAGAATRDHEAVLVTAAAHNYAQVPRRVLLDAENDVAALFRDGGVELIWVDPLVRRTTVRVHILSRSMAERARAADDVLGLATVRSGMVYVLYDRVVAKAAQLAVPQSRLLALVIAHEIGHVLLPGRGHAPWGLMSALFDRKALAGAPLRFTADERRLIQRVDLLNDSGYEPAIRAGTRDRGVAGGLGRVGSAEGTAPAPAAGDIAGSP